MNKDKRERQANFTLLEEKSLVELVLKYGSIIENKETDSDIWKKKSETWELIDSAMVVSSGIQRGSKALKNKWEKIKRNVKQRLAEEKKEMYKTGGGVVKTFKKIEYFDSIIELLGVSATGLASNFDSDVVDSSLNNLKHTTSTTVDNNEVDDLLFELEGINSPNMFDDSELFNQSSLNVVTVEQLEVTPITSRKPPNWENWTPASLRQPVSDELVTGKKKLISGVVNKNKRQRKMHNDVASKKKDVYEEQLQLIEVEKERGCMRFEWEKLEHELKVEALRLEIEIKKKTLSNLS
ncbi:uncharacterized protein LOC126552028 [Aphis gossypii]|uniref:uncharacterized protein LOC126552028 n=1 Tax=Aphis gossypii TaxID=80765 RepID=UPI002159A040|nr:uncharacterized protein LOC126552028 [Aphis gossypii]